MEDLIKVVRTYRLTDSLAERLRLADQIIRSIGPDLSLFIFTRVPSAAHEDVTQIVLIAIADGLDDFTGKTHESFWGFCHTIARRRIADFYKKQERNRITTLAPDELLAAADKAGAELPATAGVNDDLKYGLSLLKQSKPECFDYLWNHHILEVPLSELAEECGVEYNAFRMRVARCIDFAQNLLS